LKMTKTNSIKIIISLFLLVSVIYFVYLKEAKTQTGLLSVKGWAWIGADCTDPNEASCGLKTSPIGWVSLSSDNPEIRCNTIPYGVKIDPSRGEISGAAWIGVGANDNYADCNTDEKTVGWLYFDTNITPPCGQGGYPSDYCFPAKVVENEIQGWAPIISKDSVGNQIIVTWVRFKGNNYRVTLNNDKLEGYAWSGSNSGGSSGGLGWIKFLGSTSITPQAILNVQSLPITGVAITASNPLFSGTTNYSQSSTSTISTQLTAPRTVTITSANYTFQSWQGCDSSSNNVCVVSVSTGTTKTVIAKYVTSTFDLAVTSFDIRTFICKNKNFDLSYLNEYLSRNRNYEFAPSTTYAHEFYNKVASSTCPESQRNRPVEFSATGVCLQGTCPPSKLKISIRPTDTSLPPQELETKEFTTSYDSSYPKSIKEEYVFNKPYDYLITAELVDQNDRSINDMNNSNNRKEQTLRIFDYMCLLGFCSQNQRDINNPSPVFSSEPLMYRILKVFGDTDSPCRFWRNEICRAIFR
jgi:ribosomal protein L23